jgi:hypothetical protein
MSRPTVRDDASFCHADSAIQKHLQAPAFLYNGKWVRMVSRTIRIILDAPELTTAIVGASSSASSSSPSSVSFPGSWLPKERTERTSLCCRPALDPSLNTAIFQLSQGSQLTLSVQSLAFNPHLVRRIMLLDVGYVYTVQSATMEHVANEDSQQ